MDLRYSTKALIEMEAIAEIIQENSPRAALRFLDAVEATGEDLLAFPELGAVFETDEPDLKDLRICLVSGFEKYLMFYRIRADAIRIERVVYGARDIPKALKDNP
jgi:toxin ParE1/3/4